MITVSDVGCVLLQSGGECLRAYTAVGLEQIITWQDEHGN